MVRLGETEATNPLAAGELRQVLPALRFRPIGADREHHERALHAHHRSVTGVDARDLARDEAIADVAEPRAAVLLRQRRAEQTQRPHLAEDRGVALFVAKRLRHARHQLVLRVRARRFAHHPLVFAQLLIEQQRVGPVESRLEAFRGVHGFLRRRIIAPPPRERPSLRPDGLVLRSRPQASPFLSIKSRR